MLSGVSIAAPPTPNQLPIGGAVATGSATINTAEYPSIIPIEEFILESSMYL